MQGNAKTPVQWTRTITTTTGGVCHLHHPQLQTRGERAKLLHECLVLLLVVVVLVIRHHFGH